MSRHGQYLIEWSVLFAALVIAGILMRQYVRDAVRGNLELTERQLNGSMEDNRP